MIKIITNLEKFIKYDVFWETLSSYYNIFTFKQFAYAGNSDDVLIYVNR